MRKWILATGVAAFLVSSAPVFAGALDSITLDGNKGSISLDFGKDGGGKGSSAVNVPPGHMPPPGKCRIWYKGRKAGNQPAPGNCKKLKNKVPAGAVLIRG
jgi:hypothetical protein